MKSSLKQLLRSPKVGLFQTSGEVKVIVDLNMPRAGAECLARLERIGLDIRSITHNKVIGSINAEQLPSLRGDSDVREVEVSTRLKPH
jgi:hypothetical protein